MGTFIPHGVVGCPALQQGGRDETGTGGGLSSNEGWTSPADKLRPVPHAALDRHKVALMSSPVSFFAGQ